MKRDSWLLWALSASAFLAIAVWWSQPKSVESVAVSKGTITQSIVATGRIAPAARVDIGSLVTASVQSVSVYEGDHVKQGQSLIILTDNAAEASLVQAKAALAEAEQYNNELNTLTRPLAQRALMQAQSNLQLAKADYLRNLELSKKNMLAKTTLDQAKRNLDNSQSVLESAQLQLEATQVKGSSSRVILAKQEQAQAALKLAQAKVDQLQINAPISGTIINRNIEVGTTAQPGKTLLTLASEGETRIELPIDEKSIRHLQPNQSAIVIADAYPKQPFSAHLALIYPSIDAARATVNVRLLVDTPPDFLKPDMTVSVEMHTNAATNTLILPTDAIHNTDSDQPWVQVIRDGKVQQQEIQTGIRGIGNTQVLAGLSEGDWVITQTNVKNDSRVEPRAREKQTIRGFDLPNGFK